MNHGERTIRDMVECAYKQKQPVKPGMEADVPENGGKLRRGRISLGRKREILEQYDLLSKPCNEGDAAALFGVTKATLSKILSKRDDIKGAVTVKTESGSFGVDDSEGGSEIGPKLKRGRLSYEKQKELVALYDQLPEMSYSEAACKLGIREGTLIKLIASRRSINSGKRRKTKVTTDSSSDDDNSVTPRTVPSASSPQPGGSGTSRMGARRSPQPGSSGLNMALRQGSRRVRVDFSEDEQSGSDYRADESDSTDNGNEEESKDEDRGKKQTRTKKHHSLAERQKLLAKYDELGPCSQARAAKILGIPQSTLCIWLQHRSKSNFRHSKRVKIESEEEEDSDISGEEIDSYVTGSTNGTRIIQFFEVSAEEHDKQSTESTGAATHTRKPYMNLSEKFELYKKYDSMDPDSQQNAAATFSLSKSTWYNLMANRFYYEKRFKTRLCKDMKVLSKYDELDTKTDAPKVLNIPKPKLKKILENRTAIEKYFSELFGSGEDVESITLSVEETAPAWNESKALKALEAKLLRWFKKATDDEVDWEVLKEKARDLAANSGMDGFHPSDAWLRKWIKTNKVFFGEKDKLVPIYGFGENRSVSECVLTALRDYPPENVFNLVETGLYYRAVPGFSPVTNDFITVAFACNMSGTEKKKALVVGKSEAPLRFRVMPLPLEYKYSSSACITEDIFSNFLRDWDKELAKNSRKIALMLDSSASHTEVQLSRIRLFFVPMECSEAQPLSDGVVAHAKAMFRKRMAESLQSLDSSKMNRSATENIAIVDALFALAEAWESVPKALLVSKFLKSTFPQNNVEVSYKDEIDDEELQRLNKLDDEIDLHSTSDGLPCLKFSDTEISELEGGRVVHMEGTLNLSDEEEDDFDIDSLIRDQDTPDYNLNSNCGQNSTSDLGSKLKNFLQKTATPNGSLAADPKGCGSPTVSEVRAALATVRKFLQLNGGTLEDLTDYTQLEIKVLSKIKNMIAESKLSS